MATVAAVGVPDKSTMQTIQPARRLGKYQVPDFACGGRLIAGCRCFRLLARVAFQSKLVFLSAFDLAWQSKAWLR